MVRWGRLHLWRHVAHSLHEQSSDRRGRRWQILCSSCIDAQRPIARGSEHSESSDTNPDDAGNEHSDAFRKTETAADAVADSDLDAPADAVFKPLDVTLDYILKFLEGEHAKSVQVAPATRSTVLRCVKAAVVWKQTPRSSHEVENYNRKLNDLMSSVVKRMQ